MKKKLSVIKLTIFSFALLGTVGPVVAASVHQGHHQVLNQTAMPQKLSIKEAKKLADDSKVIIEGQMVKKLSDEKYEFKDATGSIIVEIDDKLWQGKAVRVGQRLRLTGEIDHHRYKPVDLDVDHIEWLN